jgi:hypothetical protein
MQSLASGNTFMALTTTALPRTRFTKHPRSLPVTPQCGLWWLNLVVLAFHTSVNRITDPMLACSANGVEAQRLVYLVKVWSFFLYTHGFPSSALMEMGGSGSTTFIQKPPISSTH